VFFNVCKSRGGISRRGSYAANALRYLHYATTMLATITRAAATIYTTLSSPNPQLQHCVYSIPCENCRLRLGQYKTIFIQLGHQTNTLSVRPEPQHPQTSTFSIRSIYHVHAANLPQHDVLISILLTSNFDSKLFPPLHPSRLRPRLSALHLPIHTHHARVQLHRHKHHPTRQPGQSQTTQTAHIYVSVLTPSSRLPPQRAGRLSALRCRNGKILSFSSIPIAFPRNIYLPLAHILAPNRSPATMRSSPFASSTPTPLNT